jgi:large subunit ribosomal protein L4
MGDSIRKEAKLGEAPSVGVVAMDGSNVRTMELPAEAFARTPNVALMHQVVVAQLAARRSGTQSTKTRAEVRGGGAKPWRQKGTGRARAGSLRAPNFTGGGVALGPKPRKYTQKTPRKMVRGALLSALSDRASEKRIVVFSDLSFETPKTKSALEALEAAGVNGSALVVLGDDDEKAYLSFRNAPKVHVVHERELNAYDVLRHDWLIFTEATVSNFDAEKNGAAQ